MGIEGGTKGERSSVDDVLVTALCARPLITAGHSRQGHGDLAVPARINNPVLARVSNWRARTLHARHAQRLQTFWRWPNVGWGRGEAVKNTCAGRGLHESL